MAVADSSDAEDGDESPLATLASIPVLTILDRICVPMLAVSQEGIVIFANGAFSTMTGHPRDTVLAVSFEQLVEVSCTAESTATALLERRDTLVRLLHADGGAIPAIMSRSALTHVDDPALLTFQDTSELLWLLGH